MMLESTHVAVHSSFRALLGVAQHFSRLRYVRCTCCYCVMCGTIMTVVLESVVTCWSACLSCRGCVCLQAII